MTEHIKKYAPRVDLVLEKGTEELLPEFVFSQCGGVWIEETEGKTTIRCYPQRVREFLRHLGESGLPVLTCTVIKEELQDYVSLTKKYFRPITVSGVTILAPWQKRRTKGPVLIIDPGMAFGTGRHESTKLMLRMMQHLDLQKKRVLDIGCGSGILAIRAAQQGAVVTAVDQDPLAVTAAKHNALLNRMQMVIACAALENINGRFDVVLANLDFDTVSKHYEALVRCVARGGHLLVSGIEAQYKERLLQVLSSPTLVRSTRMKDWYAFMFQMSE